MIDQVSDANEEDSLLGLGLNHPIKILVETRMKSQEESMHE